MRFRRLKSITGVVVCVILGAALFVSVLRVSLDGSSENVISEAKASETSGTAVQSATGKAVFQDYCAGCHFADKTDNKYGPGLKGLFALKKLPVSGHPVTEENIRKQLKTPVKIMPPITQLNEEQLKSLMSYLKSL